VSGERPVDAADVKRGERLAALREAAGFRRQFDLAASANLNSADVSRVESGRNRFTGEETQLGYSRAFGLSIGVLTDYALGTLSLDDLKKRWAPNHVEADLTTTRVLPGAPPRRGEDPIANRAAATILLRQKGYPESVLEALRTMSFKGAEDFTILDFVAKGKEVLQVFESIEPVESAAPTEDEDSVQAPPTLEQIAEEAARLPPRRKKQPAAR